MPAGSVPYNAADVTPTAGVPDAQIRSEASPQDFGSQVGEQTQKAGEQEQDQAEKYLQMATEAKAENTIANQFVPAAAELKAQYMQNKGIDAVKAQPEYLASVQNLRNQFVSKSNNPYEAQILSQFMGRHAAQETDFSSLYADQQQTEYENQSHQAMQDTYSNSAAMNYKDPAIVDQNIKASDALTLKRGLDLGQDPNTTIPDMQSQNRGIIVRNTIDSAVANNDLPAAMNVYNTYKSALAPKDLREVEAYLTPKMSDYDSRAISEHSLGNATQDYNKIAYGTGGSGGGVDPYNLGNVKTAVGSAQGTQDFVHPASPVDGVVLAANNLRSGYQGMTLAQIGPKWTGEPDKAGDWVKNASAAAGIGPDVSLNLNDPATLSKVMKGIATAEKSPTDRAGFTDDIISQGVQKSIAGEKPQTLQSPAVQANNLATNGKLIPSMGDYYKANYNNILADAKDQASKEHPDDIDFIEKTEARTKQHMDTTIKGEEAKNSSDVNTVLKALNGDFTKGVVPGTTEQLVNSSPEVKAAWDSMQQNNPKKIHDIETGMLGKDVVNNSPNGYEAIKSAADNAKDATVTPEKMESYLHEKIARKDNTGYNLKDYNDAKPLLDASQPWGKFISENMDSISKANGNVDGQGQQRAVNWANYMNDQKKVNDAKGENALPDDQFVEQMKDVGPPMPSRMQQISNWASKIIHGNPQQPAAAVPQSSAPTAPPAAAIAYLKANPNLASDFDAQFGAGSSKTILGK